MTGLEFLKRHKALAKHFILVSGHFDESWLQKECEGLNCKLLAKESIFQLGVC